VAQGVPDLVTDPIADLGEDFVEAWPRIVRALAAFTGSLDVAQEYAAEAMARAVVRAGDEGRPLGSLAAWCTAVGKRAWIDDRRRAAVEQRHVQHLAGELRQGIAEADAASEASARETPLGDALDDRVALLFVACDPALTEQARLVLALRVVCGLDVPRIAAHLGIQSSAAAARLTRAKHALAEARGRFHVPEAPERRVRLPVVLASVAGMFTVAHRDVLDPQSPLDDLGRQALSIADALVAEYPDDAEVRGLRAVVRLGLARRPGRLDADGAAVPLDEVDRSRWDRRLLESGLDDAAAAADRGDGRFVLEAAIAGLHSSSPSFAGTDWDRVVAFYRALERVWGAPSVTVARLVAEGHRALLAPPSGERSASLRRVEHELQGLAADSAPYAALDARLALADLAWRTGRRREASEQYAGLVGEVPTEPVRRFCAARAAAPPVE
jgi:predicted RNA polymerase sigma factor